MSNAVRKNEVWTQTILFIVHQPMVANKVGRYDLHKIINQFPVNERDKIKQGIAAVTEYGFFVMQGSEICLTDKGEAQFEMLYALMEQTEDERSELAKTAPNVAALLQSISHDTRLIPPGD